MQTEFIKLAVIFIVIMVMVLAKLKLRDAMIAAILLTVILFGIPLGDAAKLMIQSAKWQRSSHHAALILPGPSP